MKIRITDLPIEGLKITDSLCAESLQNRLNADDQEQFLILNAPAVNLVASPLGSSGAQIQGDISVEFKQKCSLCLDLAPRTIKLPINLQIRIKPKDSTDVFEDDIGIVYIEEESIELSDVLEETILLSIDIFWHPEFESKNKNCSICKKTKESLGLMENNQKATFKDLIETVSKKLN
jgi:uncharacterized metal-binding protein YceD (DUF177 family)